MPHKTVHLYQWICLRNVQPRTSRALSTTSAQRAATGTANAETAQKLSTDELKSLLRAEDDAALARTKRHVEQLTRTTLAAPKILDSISAKASKIRLLPEIPQYTLSEWRVQQKRIADSSNNLLRTLKVVHDNLTDLENVPYPSDSGPSNAQKFRDGLKGLSTREKEERLQGLLWDEESYGQRLKNTVGKLRGHLESLEKMRGKRKSPFDNGEGEETGREQQTGQAVASNTEGFGIGAGDVEAQTEVKAQDQFPETTNTMADKDMGDVGENKARATTTGTAKDVDVPKEVDAVEVPSATVVRPAARSSLQELQARLESKRFGRQG